MGSKSLFLLRHAKAAAGGILIADKDRPLSKTGVKDCLLYTSDAADE